MNEDYDFDCPFCGARVKQGARVCRTCGASDDCGWNTDETAGDAWDDNFDYDEFVAREFPDRASETGSEEKQKALLRLVVLAIVVSMVLAFLI